MGLLLSARLTEKRLFSKLKTYYGLRGNFCSKNAFSKLSAHKTCKIELRNRYQCPFLVIKKLNTILILKHKPTKSANK